MAAGRFRNALAHRRQFRTLEKDELRGYDSGFGFTSVCINTALYLPWLLSQCLAAGVVVKRGVLKHIAEAAAFHHTGSTADVVVNCTGLASRSLGGVADEKLFPARGQTVLVRNEAGVMSSSSDWEESDEGFVYVMERAAGTFRTLLSIRVRIVNPPSNRLPHRPTSLTAQGGGTILGGSYQKNNWSNEIDHELANRIMQRAVALCPTLTHGQGFEHLSVIRHNVGLRPARQGGVRLGAERIGAVWTVHNYGHGGFGYQSSYGCSQAVVRLVADVLAGGGAGLG
jgi:glycine/D-amino acid oxidase-like deaminating enzyme